MSEPDTSASPVHPLPHRVSELFDPSHWREVEGRSSVGESERGAAYLLAFKEHFGT